MNDTLREALEELAGMWIDQENHTGIRMSGDLAAGQLRAILAAHPDNTVPEWGIDDGYRVYIFQSEAVAHARSKLNRLEFPELKSDVLHRQVTPWEVAK